jgi:hypothetical protein
MVLILLFDLGAILGRIFVLRARFGENSGFFGIPRRGRDLPVKQAHTWHERAKENKNHFRPI